MTATFEEICRLIETRSLKIEERETWGVAMKHVARLEQENQALRRSLAQREANKRVLCDQEGSAPATSESEARWQSLIAIAPCMIQVVDLQLCVVFTNIVPSDYPLVDLLGLPETDFLPEQDRQRVTEVLRCVLETGESSTYEVRFQDGWHQTRVGPVRGPQGTESLILVSLDITSHKREEEVREQLESRVRERTEALMQEVEERILAEHRANDASGAKSRFLANMSHELRTPLNAIIGYAELMEEEFAERQEDQSLRRDLAHIMLAAERLLSIIDDLFDISKIEDGQAGLFPEYFRVPDLIDELATVLQPLIRKNNNSFSWSCEPAFCGMHADRLKLSKILFNLLDNAAKFTRDGEISLRIRQDRTSARESSVDSLVFEVSDSGIGISGGVEHLFEPFTQADESSTRGYGGTGLGLAICHRFAEIMQGTLEVTSKLGSGSTFALRVPVDQGWSKTLTEDAMDPRATVVSFSADPTVHEALYRFLSPEGYRLRATWHTGEALRIVRALRPALLVIDAALADTMDSYLKSALKLLDTSILVVRTAAQSGLEDLDGVIGVLERPIRRRLLLSAVRGCRKSLRGTVLVVDDNAFVRTFLMRILNQHGWSTMEASQGEEVLALLEFLDPWIPDLILMDLVMPVMDGFTLLQHLRQLDKIRDVPVVVLTGNELSKSERDRLGAVYVFDKANFREEELIPQVEMLVYQRHQGQNTLAQAPQRSVS